MWINFVNFDKKNALAAMEIFKIKDSNVPKAYLIIGYLIYIISGYLYINTEKGYWEI